MAASTGSYPTTIRTCGSSILSTIWTRLMSMAGWRISSSRFKKLNLISTLANLGAPCFTWISKRMSELGFWKRSKRIKVGFLRIYCVTQKRRDKTTRRNLSNKKPPHQILSLKIWRAAFSWVRTIYPTLSLDKVAKKQWKNYRNQFRRAFINSSRYKWTLQFRRWLTMLN